MSDVELTREERSAFVGEARDQIDAAEEILLEMEAAGDKFGRRADDGEKLATLFRAMHTIKGNAATVGLGNIERVAHVAEDMMERVRGGEITVDEEMADLMLTAVDQLRDMVEDFAAESPMCEPSEELLRRMRRRLETNGAESGGDGDGRSINVESLLRELSPGDWSGDDRLLSVAVDLSEDADLPAVRALQCIMACEENARTAATRPRRDEIEAGRVKEVQEVQCLLVSDCDPDELREAVRGITGIADVQVSVRSERPPAPEDGDDGSGDSRPRDNGSPQQIRVDVSVLDRLMNLSGEMVINRNRLSSLVRAVRDSDSEELLEQMGETVEEMGRATMDLQEDIMEMRLLPLHELFRRFPRMMRNLRKSSGKSFRFDVDGAETEIDRSLMEVIGDPLTHLLRNAVDHGLEPPEVRTAAGKDPEGEIRLSAHRNEGSILVQVSDDGAGIDVDALRSKARREGLLPQVDESISDEELLDIIFSPGFSTSEEVTEISGRGVGLDVVRSNIESVSGSISVHNRPGAGTTFRISLPLTVTTVKSLLVNIAGQVYVVPLSSVRETLSLDDADIQSAAGKPVLHYREAFIPVFYLRDFFPDIPARDCSAEERYVIVLQADRGSLGLRVSELLGEEDCVIKPLSRPVDDISGISAATILPDGRVALILDAVGLFNQVRSVERSVQ